MNVRMVSDFFEHPQPLVKGKRKMKHFPIKFVLIIAMMILQTGCELTVTPPEVFKDYFKTEANTEYYDEKCQSLIEQLHSQLPEYGIRRIAVIDFVDIDGRVTELGRYLSSKIMVHIPKMSKLIVVQRGHVEKALMESKISPKESYSLEETKELGKILAVDGIVFGKIVDLGTNIDVDLKLIDTKTGDLVSTATESLVRSKYAVEMSDKYVE